MLRSTTFTFPPPSCNTALPEWGSAVGIQETTAVENEIAVYPNPVTAQTQAFAKVNLAHAASTATISVYSVAGQLAMVQNVETAVAGTQYLSVNTAQLAKGLYVMILEANGQKSVCPFLVQ